MKPITRRDFLKFTLGTISAAALSGPLAAIWPEAERHREVAEPWFVNQEGGYLYDPDWTNEHWPTHREHTDWNSPPDEAKIGQLLARTGFPESSADDLIEIVDRSGNLDVLDTDRIEVAFGSFPDEPVEPEHMGAEERPRMGPYGVGLILLEEPPEKECERLGLWLVEGDRPGSDFCAVRFEGDIDELNKTLAAHAINAELR